MRAHYLFDPDFCNVASVREKGMVEKKGQGSRRGVWIDARQLSCSSMDELNAWAGERRRQLRSEVRHPEHEKFSVAEMLDHERLHLMPMPSALDGYVEEVARVSSTRLASVARSRYSVPCEWAGKMLSTRLYRTRAVVVASDMIVADHQRLMDKGKIRYDWRQYEA